MILNAISQAAIKILVDSNNPRGLVESVKTLVTCGQAI